MQKQAPSVGRILVMVLFALSCFGLLLFLWLAFGGSDAAAGQGLPLHDPLPRGRRSSPRRPTCGSPASRSARSRRSPRTRRPASPTSIVQVDAKYAPITSDSRAMLRQKTLLGETYVEITPGRPAEPGGARRRQAARPQHHADGRARRDLPDVRPEDARRVRASGRRSSRPPRPGRGQDINDFFGILPPLVDQATKLLTILNEDEDDLSRLVSNTGRVFAALSARSDQLQGLIDEHEPRVRDDRRSATSSSRRPSSPSRPSSASRGCCSSAPPSSPRRPNPLIDELKPGRGRARADDGGARRVRARAQRADGGPRPGAERVRQGPAGRQQLPQGGHAVLRRAQPGARAAQPARPVPRRLPRRADVVLRERHRRDERHARTRAAS